MSVLVWPDCVTQIVGTLRDSSGLLSGRLTVELDAPLIDTSTTPDTVYFPIAQVFTITNGAVDITLPQTEIAGITCRFAFSTIATRTDYYFADGLQYFGPTFVHTDTFTYTGTFWTAQSVRVSPQVSEEATLAHEFHSVIPNVATCEYSQLIPTGLVRDRLSSGARQIANLLAFDQSYQTALGNALLPYAGIYSNTTWYQPRQWVSHDGGSWFSKVGFAHVGNTPTANSEFWGVLGERGATGTGTSGNNTAYDATTWSGQTDAPSRNAVRNIIETLARTSQLASYALNASPNFTGTPTRNANPLLGDRSLQLPTTQWVGNEFAPIASPTLTGSPSAPTPAFASDSNALATTRWVNDRGRRILADRYTAQALTLNAFTAIVFTTKYTDNDNLFNTTTGIFTPSVDATYLMNLTLAINVTGATSHRVAVGVYSGASETYRLWDVSANGTLTIFSVNALVFLSAASSVSIRVFASGAGATGVTTDVSQSFFLNRWTILRT